MEKIVTKIGDVTIERRVSKPQQSRVPVDSAAGTNVQQQNIQLPKTVPQKSKTEEADRGLPQHNFNKLDQPVLNKNVPRPIGKNIIFKSLHRGGNFDLKSGIIPRKSEAGTMELSANFLKTETIKSQETAQESENSSQYMTKEVEEDSNILEIMEGGSLPKVPKVDSAQKPLVLNKGNQSQTKNVGNEPDLSKFIGISIERRKWGSESQEAKLTNEEDLSETTVVNPDSPDNSVKNVPQIKNTVNPQNPQENVNEKQEDFFEEEIEDSFDEEEFEDENTLIEEDAKIPVEMKDSYIEPIISIESEEPEKSQPDEVALDDESSIKAEIVEEEEEEPVKEGEQEEEEEDIKIKEEVDGENNAKAADINDLACTDLVELMQKGEIEGEIEDVKDEEIINESDKKGDIIKRKAEDEEDEEEDEKGKDEDGKSSRKKSKIDKKSEGEGEDEEGEDGENKDKNIDKSKVTNANLRKNIREVMDETKLDEATLAAQRQEAERLKRLQEQQRIIREVQRQIALSRQNQKTQNKVLSLLQGNSQTSILKTSSVSTQAQSSQSKNQNSVLVKLSNGEQTSLNNKKMIELLMNSKNKTILGKPPISKTLLKQGMVTPSVSIAPVVKKEPVDDSKKKKKGDIVTLSSDSEDDCIVLSDEDESEPEEDPTNSGMHTNDKYNLPDEKGRVIVNVGHPESETDLYLAPQIARIIKPHQIGGIRFLYDNVIESIERFQTSAGFGCILAHSMGLGKTLQIVSFSDIFLRYTTAKTILCIMPINTIQNWLAEFNMWLPKESTAEDVRCREFDLFIVNESLKNINSRAKVILDWYKSGGVLLMGYELFRLLSLKKSYKSKKKKKDVEEDDAKNKELIEEVYSALVRPGPDLVICDEGHRIKNSHATTSQALKQIRTKRRIVLTGYPLQNNLLEYWCMVDFVRPNYLGTKTEFSNMFERPIQNGQCIDSTPQDKRLMRYRAHVLHSLLEGFVQRRSHAVLQSTLPEKEEYVLLLRFTPFQRKLYDTFMNEVVRTVAVPNPLKAFAVCCKIWNHPDVLYNFLKKKGEEIDLDLEEALPPSMQPPQFPYGQQTTGPDGINQQTPMPGVPPWPRRGPGSRGGKVRQTSVRRVGRGRQPAATIPPNVGPGMEKESRENDTYNSGQFSSNENFPNQQDNMGNFQGGNYNQNRFGFGNEYNNQTGYPNPNYQKNPLNNLEDMSTNSFQSKRFFPQNEGANQGQYGSRNQNFDSAQTETNFNPNTSSDSNLNASFESNINSSDSTYNQSDSTKSFDFNQDFNSDFYSNSNFQNPGTNTNYTTENKNGGFDNNAPSYYSNPSFRSSENFDYRSTGNNMNNNYQGYDRSSANFPSSGPNPNFPQANTGSNFQNATRSDSFQGATNNPRSAGIGPNPNFQSSTPGNNFQDGRSSSGSNFPSNFQGTESNFDGNRSSNFLNSGSNYQGNNPPEFETGRSGNFQGQNSGANFQGQNPGSNFQGQNSSSNFQNQNSGTNFQGSNSGSNFQGNNYQQGYWPQSNWGSCGYPESSKSNADFRNDGTTNDFIGQKFNSFEEGSGQQEMKTEEKAFPSGGTNTGGVFNKMNCDYMNFGKNESSDAKFPEFEESKVTKPKEEEEEKKEDVKSSDLLVKKEDTSLPYDWATDLFKTYVTGVIENSSKMEVFFHIVTESIKLGDRLLVFSQSLLTLDLIEDYLHRRNVPDKEEVWARSRNYFRLDGSTPGLEREKLINEFNSNCNIHLFLVSTRAGSLGINLVGANRVVVFDASWNPCHDTQAVCRVYRYGQRKPCYVYRFVMDSCLEKKIYDRQVNKQGMADRVVDELNPDAHLSIKEVTNLCWDDQEDTTVKDFSHLKDKYNDEIIKMLLDRCSKLLSKEPFQHESLLIDRKEKKLSQAEKRLAKRSYELEKQAANQPKNIYSFFPNSGQRTFAKPIASVRPMQSEIGSTRINPQLQNRSKWIPAEVWQKQGMSAQEMTLPLDVVIPTSSPEKTSIVLKAGQRVMVLKSPKGIYMQLENGKIIAIRSAFKVGQNGPGTKHDDAKKDVSVTMTSTLKTGGALGGSVKVTPSVRPGLVKQPFLKPFTKVPDKKLPVNMNVAKSRQIMGKAKSFMLNRKFESISPDIKQRLMSGKMNFGNQEEKFSSGEQSGVEEITTVDDKIETIDDNACSKKTFTVEDNSFREEKVNDSSDEKTEEKPEEKKEMSDSLETLRKVTESISEETPKREEVQSVEPEPQKYSQINSLKNYRHNFAGQMNGKPPVVTPTAPNRRELEKKKEEERGRDSEVIGEKSDGTSSSQQPGNENVQNWLMNQSYPPMDPYGNYFPGYYAYGHGPGPMMPPYDGFYPPSNYVHPIGRNSSMVPPAASKQQQQPQPAETTKPHPTQPVQPPAPNPMVQNLQNSSTPRYPPAVNTPPMYPPYPNPYSYPYNYPGNPGFNNQGFPFPNQNQSGQQQTTQTPPTPSNSSSTQSNTTPAPYDNSMYSAFHRPDAPFQNPENPYPSPYPRPPYPSSGTPGFFPYNAPYPNYPYGHNFNPYMHPAGYGYPMQNPPPVNSQSQNSESNPSNTNSGSTLSSSNSNSGHGPSS